MATRLKASGGGPDEKPVRFDDGSIQTFVASAGRRSPSGKRRTSTHDRLSALDEIAAVSGLTRRQMIEIAGVGELGTGATRAERDLAEERVKTIGEILARVTGWAGGPMQAMAWYRAQPIPPLGHETPESLVKAGRASSLRRYLDHIAEGGFA